MLFSHYPTISIHYFGLSLLVCLGTLQWVAARNHYLTLSWLGSWGLGRTGAVIGLAMIVVAFGWFFAATPGLFQPGLAGGELSTLFGLGAGGALITTRLVGAWRQREHKNEVTPDKTFSYGSDHPD